MSESASRSTRRHFLKLAGGGLALFALPRAAFAAIQPPDAPPDIIPQARFSASMVSDIARELARTPFKPPPSELPPIFSDLSYVQYRDIWFRPDSAVWKNQGLPFLVELFHRGFYYKERIDISIVEGGVAGHLVYSPRLFGFGSLVPRPIPNEDVGFAGLRLSTDVNRQRGTFDELLVFQGASYFRSHGNNQLYGISARGLAVKTAAPEGEEFPLFRSFWVERPKPDAKTIVVHALLDSPSVAGAYRFEIAPEQQTVMNIEATLFPRTDLAEIGIAPGTSMFFFDANGRVGVDDYRPEVHDSDGLLIYNGAGEQLWRPLANPKELQVSAFLDNGPRGFGLIQRNRDFDAYQDVEARYESRPSLWVEPVGDWGPGAVNLVEIPSASEIHDNIVAYWTPREPLKAGGEHKLAYRLSWGGGPPIGEGAVVVHRTRRGRGVLGHPDPKRLFVVDFVMPAGGKKPQQPSKALVSASAGKLSGVTVADFPELGGWRLTFHLDPADAATIELRAGLTFDDNRPAETWVYRWTGD